MKFEQDYKKLLKLVLTKGQLVENRNGQTLVLVNKTLSTQQLPILTSKKIYFEKAVAEFVWFLQGRTDIEFLHKYNIKWWDSWANKNGFINKSYGHQLRFYNNIFDQIDYVINELKQPFASRRARITLWNPTDLKEQTLPCCYTDFDFIIINNKVDMIMHFRSSDLFLGLPYDVILGYLLHKYICDKVNLLQGTTHYNLANAHLYTDHLKVVQQYLSLTEFKTPILKIENWDIVETYTLDNYQSGPNLKVPLVI